MANEIDKSLIAAANQSGGDVDKIRKAAGNAAATNNGSGFTAEDVQNAYLFVSRTNKILEDKGLLPKARGGRPDREFFIKQGASLGFAIARLAATEGSDITAWTQAAIAIGKTIAATLSVDKLNKAERDEIKKAYDIYPFWVMPCFKGGSDDKKPSFDNYGKIGIDCSTERQASLRLGKIFEKYGDQSLQLITTLAAVIYGSSVRNGKPEDFFAGKYDFSRLSGTHSDQTEGERNRIRKTVDYYLSQGRFQVESNGDFKNAAITTKVNYIPSEKINAYAWQGAVQNATNILENPIDEEFLNNLRDLSMAVILSNGITCDIAYKDVAFGLIGEMRFLVNPSGQNQGDGQTTQIRPTQNKPSQKKEDEPFFNLQTIIILALLATAVYYFFFRKNR